MQSSQPIHFNLVAAAHAAMIEHGFQPDTPAGADKELAAIQAHPEPPSAPGAQDRSRLQARASPVKTRRAKPDIVSQRLQSGGTRSMLHQRP